MNRVMSNISENLRDKIRFYPDTFCTISTAEGSILECQLDIYMHEIFDGVNTLKVFKPVIHEVDVDGTIEHINGIFAPYFSGEEYAV